MSVKTSPEPPRPAATWFSCRPLAAEWCSRSVPDALYTFSVIVLAKLALVASELIAVVTDGGDSEPGSARLTSRANWLTLVIPRSANVKLRNCDAPVPASPNGVAVVPLNRTPPLSVVDEPAPCRKRVVKVAPTRWPCSCTWVSGIRSARAGAAARWLLEPPLRERWVCRSFDVSERKGAVHSQHVCVCKMQRRSAAELSLRILLAPASPIDGFLLVWACARRLARGKQGAHR